MTDHEESHHTGAELGRRPLGALLTDAGFMNEAQLAEALDEGASTGERLGELVVRRGWATEDDVAKLLAEQWGLGYVDRASIFFDVDALGRLAREEAQRLEALPTRVQDGRVVVAVAEPTEQRLTALRDIIGEDTVVVVVPKTALDAGLRSELLSDRGATAYKDARQPSNPPPAPVELGVEATASPVAPFVSPASGEVQVDATDLREPELPQILAALGTAAAEAAALQASAQELAAQLARIANDAVAAAARLDEAEGGRSDDRARIDRLERQLAQRTEIAETLKEQLTRLSRTLDEY